MNEYILNAGLDTSDYLSNLDNNIIDNFYKLLNEFPRLKYNFKELVKTHYGYNILKEHRKEEPKALRPILFTF